jgi:gas vesicle protein
VWDDLLTLIESTIRKVMSATIGAGGRTINDIINDVKDKLASTVGDIKKTVDGVTATVQTFINKAVTDVNTFITDTIKTVSGKIDTVLNDIATAVTTISDNITEAVSGIVDDISKAISGAINSLIDKIGQIIDSIRNIGQQISDGISNAIRNIGDFISTTVSDVIATVGAIISDVIETAKKWITDTYNNIKKSIEDVVKSVSEWITGVYNGVAEWINQAIANISATYESTKAAIVEWIDKAIVWVNQAKEDISAFFWKVVTNVAGWISKNVLPRFSDAVDGAVALKGLAELAWGFISKGDYTGAFGVIDSFSKQLGIPAPVNTIHAILSTIAYFWQTVNLQFIPMQVAASKNAEINLALTPLSGSDAITAVYKGLWSDKEYLENARISGMNSARAKTALEANRSLPSPGQTQQLFLRGEIDESEHDNNLKAYGFSQQHINEIKSLYAVIPPLTDIITMAVKEAFSPDVAKRFGQYEDLPPAFIGWAKKQGLSEEWAGRYWASHWDLPSPNMGFEMYQRGIVNREDLQLLLKALDIMPFWREKLIELAYNPLTRVDIRRMYKMGVITEEQVYKFHTDIGYSPANARLLTDFTKRYSAPEDESQQDQFTELARGTYSSAYKNLIISTEEYRTFLQGLKYADQDIELLISLDDYAIEDRNKLFDPVSYRKDYLKLVTQAYNRGLFNRSDALPMLVELGFTDDQAELELSLLDYNRQLSVKDTLLTQLHNQYVGFMIDDGELHNLLDTFGFYSSEVDRLIEEWGIERSYRDKRPSLSDLKGFYNKGLISLDNLLDEIRGMGYHERYIGLYEQTLAKA